MKSNYVDLYTFCTRDVLYTIVCPNLNMRLAKRRKTFTIVHNLFMTNIWTYRNHYTTYFHGINKCLSNVKMSKPGHMEYLILFVYFANGTYFLAVHFRFIFYFSTMKCLPHSWHCRTLHILYVTNIGQGWKINSLSSTNHADGWKIGT